MIRLRIGTRGSELARYQAGAVAALLRERAGIDSELVVIRTSGDRLAEAPLSQIGGKRLFVKEIEDALLSRDVDLAVHSSKDMPAALPDGLTIGAVLPRADPRDAVVLPSGSPPGRGGMPPPSEDAASLESVVQELGREPRIGTSSVRRVAQLLRIWPGAHFAPVRGNLGTRLRKLDTGEHDALVLAAAGLVRLNQSQRISAALPVNVCVPAPGQGIIAVEVREDDARVRHIVTEVDDAVTRAALVAERAVVTRLGGGCQMPLGAHASVLDGRLSMTALVISIDGTRAVRAAGERTLEDAEALGRDVGDRLLAEGAGEILALIEGTQASVEGLQP